MKTGGHPFRFMVLFTTILGMLLGLSSSALAGTITYTSKAIEEVNGGWKLSMTIVYGGMPSMAHVPMRFVFTPVIHYERYLDDAHGDKPQVRKIPLTNQMPLVESVDVNFSDVGGKIFNRTRFDFKVTRARNYEAGEYDVEVKRNDGAAMGGKQRLIFNGENPVIDRRAISFVAPTKKDKEKQQGEAAQANTQAAAEPKADEASKTAPQAPVDSKPATESTPPAAVDPSNVENAENAEKVQPSSRGCGCRTAPARETGSGWAALGLSILVGMTIARTLRSRPHPARRDRI